MSGYAVPCSSVAKKIGWGIQPWSQSCQRNRKPRSLSEGARSAFGGLSRANWGVCTMCTLWASDRVVLVPDWAGFPVCQDWRVFRGSGGYSKAGTRFESHLGHVFLLFRVL